MEVLKLAISEFLRHTVYYGGLSGLLCHLNRQPRILMLHGIGTPELPIKVFRVQLSFLRRFFEIVPLEQIWQADSLGMSARPKVALTFDDGLRNNFKLAYPILKDLNVPATFFVCPGLIDSGRWLWNHECRARLEWLSAEERRRFAEEVKSESADVEAITRKLKYMPHARRRQAEKQLAEATPDFAPTDRQHQNFDVLTWAELKTLEPGLITIGGHSTNHEILTQLDSEQLEREVAQCRTWLENELGRPVDHFCYPDGAYNDQVLSYVGRHFASAVTTKEGWVPAEPCLLELPRIPISLNVVDLAWTMQRPTG